MADEDDKLAPSSDDTAMISEAKKYLESSIVVDGDNRADALNDLEFLAGDQWDDKDKRNRQLARRPCLTINKLPTFLHQVTNDQRQNVPSIKVSPVGSGADVETAEVIQGAIRHIEYSSNADVAYDTAVNSAAAIGFGYFRLVTDYCTEDSFDQEIRFRRIRNPFTVYMDPLSEEPDGSDQRRCMISAKMSRIDFKRDYPDAQASNDTFSLGVGDSSNLNWLGADFVRIAEYYRIEEQAATLIELSNGETGWKDKLLAMPKGVTITRERKSSRSTVMLYKITALDVLERTEIKCKWIPVFPVYGDELDIDGRIIRAGIIRHAKDPAQMYNFWMTAATEEVAMRPKTPYIGAEGQFEGYEDDWTDANVANIPFLEYKAVSLDGQLAPPPSRQPMADIPQGILTMAMHANDNIKATTGLFDSSLGANGNARSGIQERSQQRQGDIANFHFTDNLNRTVRHVGRCIISMLPGYYDAQRMIRIMGEDDKISAVMINQPVSPQDQAAQAAQIRQQQAAAPPIAGASPAPGPQPLGQQLPGAPQPMPPPAAPAPPSKLDEELAAIKTVLNDFTVGEYDVTVAAGPSYSTLRQEAADSMIQFGKSWPKLMDVAGDIVVKTMDWPGATEISDRIKKTLPPGVADDDSDTAATPVVNTPKGPIPVDQASQMLQQMDQQIQALAGELQKAKSGEDKANIQAQASVEVARINAQAKADVAELTGLVQLLIARMPPPPELSLAVGKDLGSDQPISQPAPQLSPQTPTSAPQ